MDITLRKALWEILRPLIQLITNLLSPEVGEEWTREFKKFLRRESCWVVAKVAEEVTEAKIYFRRLYETETITVNTTIGGNIYTGMIRAKSVFVGYLDPDAENWGLICASIDRSATNVVVDELIRDGKFVDFYGANVDELNRRRVDWDTMVQFCKDHPSKLRIRGYATFFLLTKGGESVKADLSNVFVAVVSFDVVGLLVVGVYPFSRGNVWDAENRLRLVSSL